MLLEGARTMCHAARGARTMYRAARGARTMQHVPCCQRGLNIQSLSSKFNEFNEHICALNEKKCGPDVICLQETWKIPNCSVFNIQGYSELFVKSRHSKQGGGVGFYFKNSVKFKLVNEKSIFVDQILESIVAEIFLPCNKKAVVLSIYRPASNHPTLTQSEQLSQFMELFSNLLNDLSTSYDTIFIFGDLNIDILEFNSCKNASEYIDFVRVQDRLVYFS